jgi:hypothetical protein
MTDVAFIFAIPPDRIQRVWIFMLLATRQWVFQDIQCGFTFFRAEAARESNELRLFLWNYFFL